MPILLDEIDAVAENGLPPLVEIEEEVGMAAIKPDYNSLAVRVTKVEGKASNIDSLVRALAQRGQELAASVNKLEVSVGEIKTEIRIWSRIVGGCAAAAVVAGLAALGWCYTLGTKVTAIQQHLEDGGSTKIVAQLKNPASSEQLQANLATVSAQIQTAQVDGVKPDTKKIDALSVALSQVVTSNPYLPEAWQAAIRLVDYRFQPQSNQSLSLPDCLDTIVPGKNWDQFTFPSGKKAVTGGFLDFPPQAPWRAHAQVSNCILNLVF